MLRTNLTDKLLFRINPGRLVKGTTAYIIPDDLSQVNTVQASVLRGRITLVTKDDSRCGGKNIYSVSKDPSDMYLQKYCSESDANFGVYISDTNILYREDDTPSVRMMAYDYTKDDLKVGDFIKRDVIRRVKEIYNTSPDKIKVVFTDDSEFYGVSEFLPIIIKLSPVTQSQS
jgi:hypothetical protein